MVTEKEFLAVIHSINKFRNYIMGHKIILHIYHVTIKYLMKKRLLMEESLGAYVSYKNLILPSYINQGKTM
jgi:hypothetical protein